MEQATTRLVRPKLKVLVAEAARSLAKLDVERLEELSLSCQALNRDVIESNRYPDAVEVSEAKQEMAQLSEMLELTRANAAILSRLRELRAGRVEYSVGPDSMANSTEVRNGLH